MAALPAETRIDLIRGQDKTLRGTVLNDAGTAVDITGWTMSFIVTVRTSGTAVITKTVGSGITLTTPLSGICDIALAKADTASLETTASYRWVWKRTNSGSEVVLGHGWFGLHDV